MYIDKRSNFNPILQGRGAFCPLCWFFRDKQKTCFESNFITNAFQKFKAAKVTESFSILKFRKVTFLNLSIFGPK